MAMALTSGFFTVAPSRAATSVPFGSRSNARVVPFAGAAGRPLRGNVATPPTNRRKSFRRAAIARASSASSTKAVAKGQQARAEEFKKFANEGHNLIPLYRRIFDDQLTPILAYRCLVREDERDAPSFLLESVVGGTQTGRFSFLGSRPYMEVLASENEVTVLDHLRGTRAKTTERDPITVAGAITEQWNPCKPPGLPDCFAGGWVGYVGYDTVRYQYTTKLPFSGAPPDDRGVPDLCLGLYRDVVVFDHATKQDVYSMTLYPQAGITENVSFPGGDTPSYAGRAVGALLTASKEDMQSWTGKVVQTREVADKFGFTDVDGNHPDGPFTNPEAIKRMRTAMTNPEHYNLDSTPIHPDGWKSMNAEGFKEMFHGFK